MDARNISFKNEFDVIGAFDVIEHIEEDEIVLSQIFRAVKSGGGIILTVPQHLWLWSKNDEIACHVNDAIPKKGLWQRWKRQDSACCASDILCFFSPSADGGIKAQMAA